LEAFSAYHFDFAFMELWLLGVFERQQKRFGFDLFPER
jgi:hypothetical protein